MNYIYSTLTCDNAYATYADNGNKDVPVVKRSVLIRGGHGVANKQLMTPRGVVTMINDEELELLEKNPSFQKHVERGFLTVEKREIAPEKVADDMAEKDRSAPLTPEDCENAAEDDRAAEITTSTKKKKAKK